MPETDRRSALALAVLATGLAATPSSATAGGKPRRLSAAQQLDALMSRAAIEEVLLDYARGNDHNDIDMMRSCFWPESKHKHGGFDGTSTGFIDFAANIIARLKYCKHHISNVSIRVNGDRAFSECYYQAHHIRDRKDGLGEEDAFFEGRYIDLFERRGGVWKIIRRRGMSDWNAAVTPAAAPYSAMTPGTHALRSKDDEYYRMLALFEAG
jgi:SnoaL-like domain